MSEPNNEPRKLDFWRVEIDERHKIPKMQLQTSTQFFPYGEKNAYPDYLVQLFNRSATHSAIIKHKIKFVCGNGFKVKQAPTTEYEAIIKAFIEAPNKTGEHLNDILQKIETDYEIFNGFALEVIWNYQTKKIIAVYHKPFDSLRVATNPEAMEEGVYHSKKWTTQQSLKRFGVNAWSMLPDDAEKIPFFNPETVSKECSKQILYFKEYTAQMRPYPYPEYIACNTDIEADIEISNFDLNNVKTGFAAGAMLTLFGGKPTKEEALQIDRDIKGKMAGTDNAGQILLQFAQEGATPPTITRFTPDDMADQYIELKKRVQESMLIGHQVPNPMLVGIKTEGQLGGRTELVESYEQFYNDYISPRQQTIERVFNNILAYRVDAAGCSIEILRSKPLGLSFTENILKEVLPAEAMLDLVCESLGIDKTKYIKKPDTSTFRGADEVGHLNPQDDDKIIALFAACGIEDCEGDEYGCDIENSEDAERFESRFSFAAVPVLQVTDPLRRLYDIMAANEKISVAELSERLSTPEKAVIKMLNDLQRLNILDYSTDEKSGKVIVNRIGDVATKPPADDPDIRVTVRYKYTGPKDNKNRPFCKRMLELNRLYSRAEIDAISAEVGYSVWLRRGGWYTDPSTGISRPSCRHTFSQKVITEKI